MRENFEVSIPAGEYLFGDPCYSVPENDWIKLLETCDYFNKPVANLNGIQVFASSTAYGDGEYQDEYGRSYGVDSGLIGLVPVACQLPRPKGQSLKSKGNELG